MINLCQEKVYLNSKETPKKILTRQRNRLENKDATFRLLGLGQTEHVETNTHKSQWYLD